MPDTLPAPDTAPHAAIPVGQTAEGEDVLSNGVSGGAALSICVPTWKDSADALLATLVRLKGAEQCTLLIFDDGSADPDLTRVLARQILRFPGPARLITAPRNAGRSHARNRLTALAETDWVMFLDADMRPDDEAFLVRYREAIAASDGPSLIVGGFSLRHVQPTDETRLHAAQSAASECLSAAQRGAEPGRYVFTSNILVHRDILEAVAFDDGFKGWGWEDVDWGLRIAADYPVVHIDNTATHLGLDCDSALMAKYGGSGANFARALARHPEALQATPLYRASRLLSRLPFRASLQRLAGVCARQTWLPIGLRVKALKLFRAAAYAGEL